MSKKKDISFESKIERLDSIVQTLDEGTVPIDTMLELYEEGMGLAQQCREYLEKAEQKIEVIDKKST
ncbi:MAG TPA: exodeoxyribonuclease VII small subunit [Candidatus Kapabacteria bacterium]|nr:exodeoxyribonuclease VII small subunit [Ignavibacteria bacterium]HRK59170.1 exodeoxyribonuclease VII small subunit [Candidatus Kapabacteria bacterium]